jgi:predicted negative regulator of RcsB-dependent stress response
MILGVAGYVAWKIWKKKKEEAAEAVTTKAAPKVEVRVPTKV